MFVNDREKRNSINYRYELGSSFRVQGSYFQPPASITLAYNIS